MDYDKTKRKEVDFLTRKSIMSFTNLYESKLYTENLLDSLSKFIASLTEEELNLLTTTDTIDSISLSKRSKLLIMFNIVSNSINKVLDSVWDSSFKLGINHSIGDIVDNILPKKKDYSLNLNTIVEFAISKEERNRRDRERKYKKRATENRKKANVLRRNRERLEIVEPDSKRGVKATAMIIAKQREVYLRSVTEINNNHKRAEALKKRYLSSFYMQQRKRVLAIDYARKYDTNVKKEIRNFLKEDIASIRSIRSLPGKIEDMEQRIKDNLIRKKVIYRINSRLSSPRTIIRSELVLAYNFGKLAGYTAPEDIDRLARWNANWEMTAKIPGYEVCQACKNMHGKTFTIRQLLEIGAMTDIGIMGYKGRSKTDFKNPSLPQIPFHPNCSCFWQILDRREEKAAAKDMFSTLVDNAVPLALATTVLVGGGFLLSRSNAFKQFIRSAFNSGDDLIRTTTPSPIVPPTSGGVLDDVLVKAPTVNNIEDIEIPRVEVGQPVYRPSQQDETPLSVKIKENLARRRAARQSQVENINTPVTSEPTSESIQPNIQNQKVDTPEIPQVNNIPEIPTIKDIEKVEEIVKDAVEGDMAKEYIQELQSRVKDIIPEE